MKKVATVLALVMVMTGCATQTATIRPASQAQAVTETHKFFVSGIGQEKEVNAAQVCGGADKVAQVQSSQQPKDILFGLITLGIYTPHTAVVSCR